MSDINHGVFSSNFGLFPLREWDADANLFVDQPIYNSDFTMLLSPYYNGYDGDVDEHLIVLLAGDTTTFDLKFWWINPVDGTVNHSVSMDSAYGGYAESGEVLFSGTQQIPMVLNDGLFTIIFGVSTSDSSYRIIQFDAVTGTMVTDQTVSTGDTGTPFVTYAIHRTAGGFYFVRYHPAGPDSRIYHVDFNIVNGHVDLGTLTGLSWTTSDVDAQMLSSTWMPISEGNDIQNLYGIAEHPNGNLLLVGSYGTVAEVVPATGTVINVIKPEFFGVRYSLGLAVDPDGEHVWLTNQATSDNMGLAPSDESTDSDFIDWTGRFDYDGNLISYWGGTQSGNPTFLKSLPEPDESAPTVSHWGRNLVKG